jgi:hypothetical protein
LAASVLELPLNPIEKRQIGVPVLGDVDGQLCKSLLKPFHCNWVVLSDSHFRCRAAALHWPSRSIAGLHSLLALNRLKFGLTSIVALARSELWPAS